MRIRAQGRAGPAVVVVVLDRVLVDFEPASSKLAKQSKAICSQGYLDDPGGDCRRVEYWEKEALFGGTRTCDKVGNKREKGKKRECV